MSEHFKNLVNTREVVSELEERDKRILLPLIDGVIADYQLDSIRFAQVGHKFVVDATEFRCLLGFGYLQEVLKRRGDSVAHTDLSPISKTIMFEPVEEPALIRSTLNRQKALEKKLRWLQAQKSDDPWDEDVGFTHKQQDIAEELLKLKAEENANRKFLSKTTFGGRIKYERNDYDRNRETVVKCMRRAIQYLVDHEDTTHIGLHLNEHLKPRARTRYTGDWGWIFE